MRFLKFLFIFFCVGLLVAPPDAQAARKRHRAHRISSAAGNGTRDARYADFILNPVTGEVYHEVNANERRYPASLTKMMTLYLLFEALDQHKTTMNARFDVSDYASTMPRTSLSLQPGDSVPVETAIKALIVLSANDVAVVVAEALGGDVDHFGEMMTAKARALGMNNTVFQNPNGLPNADQYTTARDMAKLGIALKRDFPAYYRYFQTRQFSWRGATYYTHNRVMLRYQGTDGIKTGFTGAAGFNLVTSVSRGGRPLVGVVLGGASGGWRDNRMIALLDASYKMIAQRGAVRGRVMASNLPTPRNGVGAGVGISPMQAATEVAASNDDANLPEVSDGDDVSGGGTAESPAEAPIFTAKPEKSPMTSTITFSQKPEKSTISLNLSAPAPFSVKPEVPSGTAPLAPKTTAKVVTLEKPLKPEPVVMTTKKSMPAPTVIAVAAAPSPVMAPPAVAAAAPSVKPVTKSLSADDSAWGIQVGAFSTYELAAEAAQKAVQIAAADLAAAKISVAGPVPNGATVHRARLENLAKTQAIKACEKLISKNSPCFIYRAEAAKI